MKYEMSRKSFQSGDVIVWSGNSFFSKIIKFFTKSIYTHVGIVICFGERIFIVEALEGKGVGMILLSKKKRPFYRISNIYWWNEYREIEALQHLGENYSFVGCIKAYFKFPNRYDHYWQCAEFVNHILELGLNEETPYKVVNFLLKNKECTIEKVE